MAPNTDAPAASNAWRGNAGAGQLAGLRKRYGLYGDCRASQAHAGVRFGLRPAHLAQRWNVPAAQVAPVPHRQHVFNVPRILRASFARRRCRGERARLGAATPVADGAALTDPRADGVRARSAWARLIYKVYEVDPLECPKCKGPMQVTALIDDPAVVRRILTHLHLGSPAKRIIPARGPPVAALVSAQGESLNEHTYHPVPVIA